jgi:hypothetical protein
MLLGHALPSEKSRVSAHVTCSTIGNAGVVAELARNMGGSPKPLQYPFAGICTEGATFRVVRVGLIQWAGPDNVLSPGVRSAETVRS